MAATKYEKVKKLLVEQGNEELDAHLTAIDYCMGKLNLELNDIVSNGEYEAIAKVDKILHSYFH